MPEPTGPSDPTEPARRLATDPGLPAWTQEVVGKLLDGDGGTLDLLEHLATESAVLFDRGRDWLTEHPPR